MNVKLIPATFLIFFAGVLPGYALEIPEVGAFSLDGKLTIDYFYHELGDHWKAEKSGYKDINYTYAYGAAGASLSPLSYDHNVFGETLSLDMALHPLEELTAVFGFEFIKDYADRFWMPVNLEHRLKVDDRSFSWNTAEIKYDYDFMSLRYFRGIGHYSWKYEGDLFNIYPEQYATSDYLRITGRSIPEGFEFLAKGTAGQLQLIYGPEVIWGYRNGFYGNYNFQLGKLDSHLIYRDHIVPYGEADERMQSAEVSTKYDISKRSQLELGVLFQPFRLDRDYISVEKVADGTGYLGSNYLRKTGTTSLRDAFGASSKLTLNPRSVFDNITLKYTFDAPVAGNKQELNAQFFRKLSRTLTGCIEYAYRKPLIGPVPQVYEGTSGNTGPILFELRGPDSPFWVNWDNRETSAISFIFTFDPTPETWFYRFEPNVGEAWNLNPEEDAPVSFSARYTLAKYFSGTDRLYYWNENGDLVWEPSTVSGAWATDDYIGSFNIIGKIFLPNWRFIADMGFGDSLATGSYPYSTTLQSGKPVTNYFTTGVSANTGRYTMQLRFSQNDWGPEQWQRHFGETFDALYQASVSRVFTSALSGGIGYIAARANSDFLSTEDLGNYDEFHAFVTLSFGPIKTYWGKPREVKAAAPALDTTPPEVSLVLSTQTITPNGDGVNDAVLLFPWASDFSGIRSWEIFITDSDGNTVKTYNGNDTPPNSILWDGKDDVYNKVVPEGQYAVQFEATDVAGNRSVTDPITITVAIPPKVIVKEVIKEITREIKVEETRRGLLVSLTSHVLFDFNKSTLKSSAESALQETLKIIKAYPENRVSVEGHTDSVGSREYNQGLSERRAKSVADYFIRHGIAAERITDRGFGEDKPIADNATGKGREANRRVEVIILR